MRVLIATLLILVIAAPGRSQDAQTPAGTKQDQPAESAKPADAQADEEKPPPKPRTTDIRLGYSSWNLDGNEQMFRQYATPPKGLFLSEFRYSPFPTTRAYGLASLKGIGETDYRGDGSIAFENGKSRLEGSFSRNKFFDPSTNLIDASQRDIHEIYYKQMLVPGFALSLRHRNEQQDVTFDIPALPLHQRTRYSDVLASGKIGPGHLRLGLVDWRYFDRTEQLLDTKVTRYQLSYLWEISRAAGVEAAVAKVRVRQPGAETSNLNVFSLVGDVAAGESTDVVLGYHRDTGERGVTQNAYAREQQVATARVVHRWRRWTGQLSLQGRDVERVRGDQTYVDTPRWITVEGRVSGRPRPNLRLTLRGYNQSLSEAPPAVTTDTRPLTFDNRRFAQLRLDGGQPNFNGYLTLTHRNWELDARSVSVDANLVTVGGNWEARPNLSIFAEFTHENWGGETEAIDFPTFGAFAPDSNVLSLGASWIIDSATFLSANFTHFKTENDNPTLERHGSTSGSFFTLNARKTLRSGNEIGLIFAPWFYRDRVSGAMDYDARVLMLTASARF